MEKSWYKSKGIWGGLLITFGGIATASGQFLGGSLDWNTFLTTVLPLVGNGLGIIGIRTAQK